MTAIEESLNKMGLNSKEAAIYLAALELGQDTVASIAKKAGVKRPTAYLVLEELQQRGLMSTITKSSKKLYSAEEPNKLLGVLAEQQRALKTILPYLEAINNRGSAKPRVRFYEGKEGIRSAYQECYQAKDIRYFGSIAEMTKDFRAELDYFEKISQEKHRIIRDILMDTPDDHAYAKKVARPGYEIRFFPKDAAPFAIDCIILENKVIISSFRPELNAVVIESKNIADGCRAIWNLAWRAAIPVKN